MNHGPVSFRTIERSNPSITAEGLEFITVKSPSLRRRADVTIYVPPAARDIRDLPIVVLLHGVYGSHWAWTLKGRAHLTANRLIAKKILPPVALVMPSDGLWGDGSGYVTHPGLDAERWIMDDVPALARELIDGCSGRSPLLLAGLSMGGFGALRLAAKYPARITAAAALSAITEAAQLENFIEESLDTWGLSPTDCSILMSLLDAPAPLPPLRIDCGLHDPLLHANRNLHHALERARVNHLYSERAGGHDWLYWTSTMEHTLTFFGDVLEAGT